LIIADKSLLLPWWVTHDKASLITNLCTQGLLLIYPLPVTVQFQAKIEQFGLTQHVAESTHRCGGWLDIILTRDDCSLVDFCIQLPTISDHGLVTATIPFLYDVPSLSCQTDLRMAESQPRCISVWRYLKSQQLLTRPSWLTSR